MCVCIYIYSVCVYHNYYIVYIYIYIFHIIWAINHLLTGMHTYIFKNKYHMLLSKYWDKYLNIFGIFETFGLLTSVGSSEKVL